MCRITALTATDLPRQTAAALLHDTMLRSNADGQPDGHGLYWGKQRLYKDSVPYWKADPDWIEAFVSDPDEPGIVLGHVRAASANTWRTNKEAHPYVFLNEDGSVQFVGAHNGFIQGTYKYHKYETSEPNTDSYRAFHLLHTLLLGGAEMGKELIQEWMGHYEKTSAFAIVILHDGKLYAFRNEDRTLHFASVGNGVLINTSDEILRKVSRHAAQTHGIELGQIFRINPNHLFVFEPGKEPQAEEISINFTVAVSTAVTTWSGGITTANQLVLPTAVTTSLVKSESVSNVNVGASNGDDDDSLWERARRYAAHKNKFRLHIGARELALWSSIRAKLNPCRSDLAALYAVLFSYAQEIKDDLIDADGRLVIDPRWQNLTLEQLAEFNEYLDANPLTSNQKYVINQWNKKIEPEVEVDEQLYAFGTTLFFHLPSQVALQLIEELDRRAAG